MQESIRDRQNFLFSVADNFLAAREAWGNDVGEQGLTVGGTVWMAAENMVAAFATGTIPGSCRGLCKAVEHFERYWKDHVARAESHPTDDLLPGDPVWKAANEIEAAREGSKPREVKRLETVAELASTGVDDIQIAKIYGWKTNLGQWDIQKVRQAKLAPGKYDGDEYYAEKEQKLQQSEQATQQLSESLSQHISEKTNSGPTVGPESIETLVAQGLTVAQICDVKLMPPADVLAYMRENGMQLDDVSQHNEPLSIPHEIDQGVDSDLYGMGMDIDEADADPDVAEHTLDEDSAEPAFVSELDIIRAADNNPNMMPAEIAKIVNVDEQRVMTVLSRRAEIEEAV